MDLVKLHTNLKSIDVVDIAYIILDDMSNFIADLNRKRLIDSGEDSNNSSIGEYSDTTIFLKNEFGQGFGQITDHVTWYSTGDLHKSIFSSVIGDELIVDATDPKLDELEDHYNNKEVLGLTDKELVLVKNEFLKRFWPKFNEQIYR